ncbi:hypothetical protein BGX33_009858 [Mortierella sp. NVP41]|nr:hypothetical protein BGX33_009858 [Mortierella sp. NVP41]
MSTPLHSTKDLLTLENRVNRSIELIQFHETTERSLIAVLSRPPNNHDGSRTYIFNGTARSEHQLRCQLYKTRLYIHRHSIDLRDANDIVGVLVPENGLHNTFVMGQKFRNLTDRLQAENDAYNSTPVYSVSNALFVSRDRWLMYEFGQKFREFTCYIPHPGGTNPDDGFAQRRPIL